ncbi:MAG: GntR family transcriptional regulator [Anaerolineae bacterium]|nr:GntR family transcriptional regulator [Anaerolineae bacterium]
MTNSFAPIEETRRTLAAQVEERIREAILKRQLRPGERIDQNKLADELQVSMAPIREALKGLEAEGLVKIQPRRGVFVVELSVSDMDELYFTRQLIEGEAIYHAVPHLTETDFAALERMITAMRQATDAGDIPGYIALNRQFHLRLYSSLANNHLLQVIQMLWDRSELYRYRYMFMTRDTDRIHQEHEGILDACRQGDQELAKDRARQHIFLTQRELDRQLTGDLSSHRQDNV